MTGHGTPFSCRFLDKRIRACSVSCMRRRLEIRVAFAPTRLSAEHLRVAYEVVSAVVDRTIVRPCDIDAEHELGVDVAPEIKRGTR